MTASCNRIFCREIRTEQVDRAGVDPAEPEQPQAQAAPTAERPRFENRQGSGRFDWQNVQLQVFKEIHWPDSPIPANVLSQFYADLEGKWTALPQAEKDEWDHVHTANVLSRQQAQVSAAATAEQPDPTATTRRGSVWEGAGSSAPDGETHNRLPVDAKIMADIYNSESRRRMRQKAFTDEGLVISEAIPRASLLRPNPDGSMTVTGCYSKKTRCKHILADDVRGQYNREVAKFNSWVDSLGQDRKSTEHLLLLEGTLEATPERPESVVNMACLIMHVRGSPKVEIVGRCALKSEQETLLFPPMREADLPVVLRLVSKPSKLKPTKRTLNCGRSDDICRAMAEHGGTWRYFPLTWRKGEDPLVDHIVTGFGAEWVKPGRQRHDDVIPVALRQTSVDPFAAGAAQVEVAEPMGEVAEPPGEGDDEYGGMGDQAGGAVAPEAEADDVDVDVAVGGNDVDLGAYPDDDIIEDHFDLDDDVFEDHLGIMEEVIGGTATPVGDVPVPGVEDPVVPAEESDPGDGDQALELAEAAEPEDLWAPSSPKDAAETSIIRSGYVWCRETPWVHLDTVGRLSVFPKNVPERNQRISMVLTACGNNCRAIQIVGVVNFTIGS